MPAGGPRAWIAAVTLALALVMAACGGDDPPAANRAPTIDLTAGPMDGDSAAWNARFHWYGTDPDGYVDHYEYALDVDPGQVGDPHTPTLPEADWTPTTALEGTFPFTTPDADSTFGTDGLPGPPTRWTGNHTFVIRAVDDDGARSPAAFLEFTALNYAPRTTIEGPGQTEVVFWFPSSSCSPRIRWHAVDPDDPAGAGADIVGYDIRIRQMPLTWVPVGRSTPALLAELAGTPWSPVPAGATDYRPVIQTGYPYIVAVRARDGRGAVESVFQKGRNLFVAESGATTGDPMTLTVRERVLGQLQFPGPPIVMAIGTGAALHFELSSNAEWSGLGNVEFSHGVDVDPESDPAGAGWSGWSGDRTLDPVIITTAGRHSVTIRARAGTFDCPAVAQVGATIDLDVIDFPFDRELLYVDDFRNGSMADARQDQRNRAMLAAAGVAVDDPWQFTQFDPWGMDDTNSEPAPLTLEDLASFRTVYWDVLGSGAMRNPLILGSNACHGARLLQAYVAGGGALWVTGQMVMAGFKSASNASCLANTAYEFGSGSDGLTFDALSFINEFLGITGGGFLNVRSNLDRNGLASAMPAPEGGALGMPRLDADREIASSGVLPLTDAMFTPTFDGTGGLDTLYVHGAPATTSGMHRRPNAFRYHDPGAVPDQGPVAIFLFPLAFMSPGSVTEGTGTHTAARLMLDWLRSEGQRFRDTHPR